MKHDFFTRSFILFDVFKFGEELSGCEVIPFDIDQYQAEYRNASKDFKDDTSFGRFMLAAMRQKSMVTNAIFESGNMLAGFSVDYLKKGFRGIKDFEKIVKNIKNEVRDRDE